jgi:hypothetical protein
MAMWWSPSYFELRRVCLTPRCRRALRDGRCERLLLPNGSLPGEAVIPLPEETAAVALENRVFAPAIWRHSLVSPDGKLATRPARQADLHQETEGFAARKKASASRHLRILGGAAA